jgi:hypothetical protein
MKKPSRKMRLSSETLRVLDPKELKKAGGNSLVTTTTQLPTCHHSVISC